MVVLNHLEPQRVFHFFEELCAIPHGSGNTKAVSDWLVDFAKARGLRYVQDQLNNVVIFQDAAPGYESAEPVDPPGSHGHGLRKGARLHQGHGCRWPGPGAGGRHRFRQGHHPGRRRRHRRGHGPGHPGRYLPVPPGHRGHLHRGRGNRHVRRRGAGRLRAEGPPDAEYGLRGRGSFHRQLCRRRPG